MTDVIDEGLVERVAAVIRGKVLVAGSTDTARAVLAEIGLEKWQRIYVSRIEEEQKRVAELEVELKRQWSRESQRLRNLSDKLIRAESDLSTVTRERDELLANKENTQLVELAEAKAQRETDAAAISDRDELLEAFQQHLAEAREELRIHHAREDVLRGYYRPYLSNSDRAMLEALDAHRAKTSEQKGGDAMRPIRERQARAEREVMSAGGREGTGSPAFETAPRLTEWRYRVVDSTRLSGSALLAAGHEFVATGEEEHVGHGWYRLVPGYSTVYRVVRVEPEKAQGVTCRHCGATNSPGADHCAACLGTIDGGGERSGQVDEGPPRVGDVVRGEYIGEREVLAVDDARRRVHLPDQAPDYWHSFEGLTVVRRAGQPEAKAEGALRPGDKGYQPQPSGPPLLDPHAGTVADLVAKVARLENVVLAFWGNGTVSTCYEAVDKIRAERAGRKLWLTRTTSSLAT